MTVNFHEEIPGPRNGKNTKGVKTYVRAFRLSTTLQSEGPYAVGSHPSLPLMGSAHNEDSGAWCYDISIDNTDPWKGWTATYQYSSEREFATDPTLDPAIITVNTEQFQKVADRDIDGYSICNSAGDPFDPPYMMDDSRRVIMVSKNMSGHPSWLLDYQDVVNIDSFTVKGVTYTAGQGKVQRVSIGEQQVRNGVPFVVVQIEIHLQRDGWHLKPLDAGFRQLAYDGLTRINIYNPAATPPETGDSERITAPVPLDGAGKVLANPTTSTAVFGDFIIYKRDTFSALPLT